MPGRKLNDQVAVNDRRRVRCNNQAAIRRVRKGGDRALDLGGVAQIEGICLDLSAESTAWITPNRATPEGVAASRRTATRVMPGAISLRSSSHFPLVPYSNEVKPVALPPGRARLATNPAPTGSATIANTIGMVRVTWSNGPTAEAPGDTMTSGARAANSVACLRTESALAVAQRVSTCTFRPMVQPDCPNACRNAEPSLILRERRRC